jgi:hypothetical protein
VSTAPRRHPWLHALGKESLPDRIEIAGATYALANVFKHDFFAATALYAGDAGRVVLKLGRTAPLFLLPMRWLGRALARHEARLYRLVSGVEGIPRFLGEWGATGIVHEYVEGRPLQPKEFVPDDFFEHLHVLVAGLHARQLAYADLEKNENILLDSRGRPALIDFQISWHWPLDPRARGGLSRLLPHSIGRRILKDLQVSDLYHFQKHRRRHRRDQMTKEEIARSYVLPPGILWHRRIANPFQRVRRRMLRRLTGQSRSPKQVVPLPLEPVARKVPGHEHAEHAALRGERARRSEVTVPSR